MKKFKKPFLFSAAMLPLIVAAVILTAFYQIQLYPADIIAGAVNQLGSKTALIILSAVQGSLLVAACCFFGYILADKTGLWIPLYIERDKLFKTIALATSAGLVFSLDYWTFGACEPLIQSSITGAGLSAAGFGAAVLYGGIVEKILMRLFLMSLIAFILWKLFFRNTSKNKLPDKIFISAKYHLCSAVCSRTSACNRLPLLERLHYVACKMLFAKRYLRAIVWPAVPQIRHLVCHGSSYACSIVSKAVWLILI